METTDIFAEIEALEQEIIDKKNKLIELRKSVPRLEVKNYLFKDSLNQNVSLLDLFGGKDELMVIQNMGKSCAYCTMWADGFNGVYHHIIDKAAFVLASPDSPEVQDAFAAERRWQFPMVSTMGTSFKEDLGFVKDGYPYPGVSTFHKDADGKIFHVADAPFGPGDDFCVVWPLFDLLASGQKGYHPQRKINKTSNFDLTNNVAIQVTNQPEAVAFYTNIIGMKEVFSNDSETKLTFGGQNFYIEENEGNNVFFEFAVKDFPYAKEQLVANGCTVTNVFSEKSIMMADPFGLHFHVFEQIK
ncbi:DUF899 family protein [Caldibacillus lycopersici]|uniref:DUF899 family protein n=1 Tax=Perspicuibacillus lycopersici TaxID=1325689 RepID=A0AAE3LU08_9BACI|nr:DUF899 family protein [Perspicuibacillus lycopersici]MCU9614893.1 DUF899 family protein [Perspicuibacillus lycopersici]